MDELFIYVIYKRIDSWLDRWTDSWLDRWTDSWMYRCVGL